MFVSSFIAAASLLPAVHGLAAPQASKRNDNVSISSLAGALYNPPDEPWGFCPEASWPPTPQVGQRITPQSPLPQLQELLGGINVENIDRTISTLAGFGTRHTLSQTNSTTRGIGAAREWLLSEMRTIAEPMEDMEVYYNSYIQPEDGSRIVFPVNITNVVGRINGTEDPDRVYIITAHYDSRNLNATDYTGDAPGADDDASGVAVVLEVMRAVAMGARPKATMMFAAVAGEEQGLYGSANLAQTIANSSQTVAGNWNDDTVGTGHNEPFNPINDYTVRLFGASIYYPNATTASIQSQTGLTGYWNDSPAHQLGRFIAECAAGAIDYTRMQVKLIYRPDRFLRGGDHSSFLEAGFASAVRITEAVEDFVHQHQDVRVADSVQYGDLIEFVDFEYVNRVARTNLASMWAAANAPAAPTNVTISTNIGFTASSRDTPLSSVINRSKFCWATGDDTLANTYELVWRPSGSLQWTNSIPVAGNSSQITVPLTKDDLQFGVRAVGADGLKSPAVAVVPGDCEGDE